MKIGILTWFCAMNYGAQAQTYALANVIRELGYDCEEVAYYPAKIKSVNLKTSLNMNRTLLLNIKNIPYSIFRMFKFRKFIKTHIISKKIKNMTEIDKLNYDLIIIGSDELVNCGHPLNEKIYFGVGINQTPLMYYAPSSGALDTAYKLGKDAVKSMKRFIALSGRDKHTCEFLSQNAGKPVEQILDPTLLYHFEDLTQKINIPPYLLIYSFDAVDSFRHMIEEYANSHNLKIVMLGRTCKWADLSKPCASEKEWISLFKYASLVFTDSFHGLVFSIKNNINFVLVGRGDKLNKNNDILEELGIRRRYYDGKQSIEEYMCESPIDFETVQNILEHKIVKSKKYLINNLEKIK